MALGCAALAVVVVVVVVKGATCFFSTTSPTSRSVLKYDHLLIMQHTGLFRKHLWPMRATVFQLFAPVVICKRPEEPITSVFYKDYKNPKLKKSSCFKENSFRVNSLKLYQCLSFPYKPSN